MKPDSKDHEETVQGVLQRCRQVNLKLNKDECHFRCTSVSFFGEVILQNGVKPDLPEDQGPDGDASKNKKEHQAFLGIINYLGKFSPSTTSM